MIEFSSLKLLVLLSFLGLLDLLRAFGWIIPIR